ncbi:hypothetical protein BN874_2260010 [Candidatus Contendobacter odensis Run_B_J11]|uniref:Resolvase/invertase-type recombinase catalytic domain-containing protein n=1 Tax=Candidatus Contendobacter odensis Run_B_J11 TaxID=1400861 RepID=A0A7U7J3M2_9GAMM|nr:hypothetical protein BN874_2260010 [Candidatus Contendobacter odensis Run_B_J11]
MHIGYARVSTGDQNPDLQRTALKQAGCTRLFTDTATGAHVRRPELMKCLKSLNAGDTLTVWKLDRLGRSLRDLISLLDDLKARGVAFPDRSGGYHHAHRPGDVANGGHSGGTGTLLDSGTDSGRSSSRHGAGSEDGPQVPALAATDYPCPAATGPRGTP